jgi:thymidylate synthase (FAD)
MRSVEPEIFLVARPKVDYDAMAAYLHEVGGERWLERLDRDQLGNDAQDLAEFAGKMCYRSWEPGLNPNVRKVRDDQAEYLQNILKQAHGSVLEHVSFTFVLHNVSRVFTMKLSGTGRGRRCPRSRCASSGSMSCRSGSPSGPWPTRS